MKKILHVTNLYPTKKNIVLGVFVKEQIESLNKLDMQNDIYFINAYENGVAQYLKAFFKLRNEVSKYDIIHCHHVFSGILVSFLRKRPKTIISLQNDGVKALRPKRLKIFRPLLILLYKRLLNKADEKIFKTLIPNDLKSDSSCHYIPNGVNEHFFKPIDKISAKKKLGLALDKKYVLFVSSNFIRPQKRYDIFSKVLLYLKENYKYNNIEELCMVKVKRELVPYYFNACEFHLLTSDFEGSPNSVKEALFCNTPVISRDAGNVSDLLNGLNMSKLIYSNDPKTIASFCNELILSDLNEDSRNHMLKKGYDMDSVAQKIFSIYNEI